jgi:hypothetical protein
MEANSDTKAVIFPATVAFNDEVEFKKDVVCQDGIYIRDLMSIQALKSCDACTDEGVGFEFDVGGKIGCICIKCIRLSSMTFVAKENWANKTGDPMAGANARIKALEEKITKFEEVISTKTTCVIC